MGQRWTAIRPVQNGVCSFSHSILLRNLPLFAVSPPTSGLSRHGSAVDSEETMVGVPVGTPSLRWGVLAALAVLSHPRDACPVRLLLRVSCKQIIDPALRTRTSIAPILTARRQLTRFRQANQEPNHGLCIVRSGGASRAGDGGIRANSPVR